MNLSPDEAREEDAAVFARVAGGDPAAFAEFFDRHSSLLYGVALKILGNEQDAEDVLQDACVLLWERAPLYRPGLGHPVAWAVALTRNKSIDRLRASRRRTEVMGLAAEEPVAAPGAGVTSVDRVISAEAGEAVARALTTLPVEQREAIELAFLGGLTQQEISQRLGQPLGTIKARIRRGMLALRDVLEGQS
ncbi:MAG: sigma-70 family RNA polymerase sigma factor [Verrucomicrobia bacterium]|nr:sigma-70 family RNA polymerase sigma factor [Verrucomicrobiota bacterium]